MQPPPPQQQAPAKKQSNCGGYEWLIVLKGMGILGSFGAGFYSTYMALFAPSGSEENKIRWKIIFFFLAFFSVLCTSAELNLLKHPAMAKYGVFLTSYIGRAIFYIFIGGLLLKDYGFIPGCWLLGTAILNIFALCCCKDAIENGGKKKQQNPLGI